MHLFRISSLLHFLNVLFLIIPALCVCVSTLHAQGVATVSPVPIGPEAQNITVQSVAPDGMTLAEMDNGLTILVKENHTRPAVTVQCHVGNTGSVFEAPLLGSGISRFVERLLVNGSTRTRSREQISELVFRLGGQLTSRSGKDSTCYQIDTTSLYAAQAIDLISDLTQNAVLDPEDYEREKTRILHDFQSHETQPDLSRLESMSRFFYTQHPLRHPMTGYENLFQALTRNDVLDFYTTRYVPNNMLLVIVGDVDTAEIHRCIRASFSGKRRGQDVAVTLFPEPRPASVRQTVIVTGRPHAELVLIWPSVVTSAADKPALDVISHILTRGDSSRLVSDIQNDRQLAYRIASGQTTHGYVHGMFYLEALHEPSKGRELEQEIMAHIDRLCREGVTDAELEKAKKQFQTQCIIDRQNTWDVASMLADDFLATGDPLYSDGYLEQIRRLTPERIREVSRRYLDPQIVTKILFTPQKQPPITRQFTKTSQNEIVPVTLQNGVRILLKQQSGLPMVTMHVISLGSALTETRDTSGRSRLFAQMLDKGNAKMNALEMADYFDSLGGKISFHAGRNTVYGTTTVLREDFLPSVRVLFDAWMTPTFPEREFAHAKELAFQQILTRKSNPIEELIDEFAKTLPEATPYSILPGGTSETIAKLSTDDLRRYHHQYITTDNLLVTVFGDFDTQNTYRILEETFGQLPQSESFPVSLDHNNQILNPIEKHLKTDKSTATLMIGYPVVSIRNASETASLLVLDAVMSGYEYQGGWLDAELGQKGLVRSIHAELLTGPAAGYFIIYAQTTPEQLDEVRRRINDNIEKAKRGEITPEELATNQEMMIATHARKNQTLEDQSLQAGLDEIYGLGYNHDRTFADRIQAVTVEQITAAAKKHFDKPILITISPDNHYTAELQ